MMSIRKVTPPLFAILAAMAAAAACGASQQRAATGGSNGNDKCLPHGAACSSDQECCSLWCANSVCVHKQP